MIGTSWDLRPPVLLASASAGGTIASARVLATTGLRVHIISSGFFDAAAWVRGIARSYRAPAEAESEAFLEKLLAIGRASPGQVLLPTSDETAWLYTRNRRALEQYFLVYQPALATMRQILDKKLLGEAASRVGIPVVPSWFPTSTTDVISNAASLRYPILIKPRTQVHRIRNNKGWIANDPNELVETYSTLVAGEEARKGEDAVCQDDGKFILQEFGKIGAEGVHSISGFIDQRSELFVTRRSAKVFQRTRPVGVGVCYESMPSVAELAQSVYQLCCELGYFGIFEIEFIRVRGKWALIDFNPRFYNQMALDINRGLPLPILAYLDACGDRQGLIDAVSTARVRDEGTRVVAFDHFTMQAILLVNRLVSLHLSDDDAYWRDWVRKNSRDAVDIIGAPGDPLPTLVHALSEIYLGLKAFPRLLRARAAASLAFKLSGSFL